MNRTQRLGGLCLLLLSTLSVVAVPVARAAAASAPPPGVPAGAGRIEGTEIVDEGSFLGSTGALCLKETKSIYGLRGVGSYKGKTPSGQEVVYQAAVEPGQPVYAYGPLQVQVENTNTYYLDPFGTHGTDSSCTAATTGDPVLAEFRIFAPGNVYRLDGSGAQAPCVGHGTFARGDKTDPNKGGLKASAAWALDADCTVIGNPAGTPGTGIAPAGSPHTYTGQHDACFNAPCSNNLRLDYNQYFPFKGLNVSMAGPSSAQVGTAITVTAGVTNDGVALPNAPVAFTVAGPTPSAPPAGAAATAADGTAPFTFAAAAVGDYTVTATATNTGVTPPTTPPTTTPPTTTPPTTTPPTTTPPTTTPPTTTPPTTTPPTTTPSLPTTPTTTPSPPPSASSTFTVHVTTLPPPPQPAMALDGPTRWHTEDPVTVTATFTDAAQPLPGTSVAFTVAGPPAWQGYAEGQASPASGSATTDQNGQATFSFSAGRSGDYTVTASSTLPGLAASATRVVHLDIKTIRPAGSVPSSASFLPDQSAPGLVDPAGRYAYSGRNQLQRFDLSTFQPAGLLAKNFDAAVIDPAGNYAYLGSDAQVLKVDLRTMQQVAAITLSAEESGLRSAVIDPAGRYAYFGTGRINKQTYLPGRVIKIDLQTFQRVDAITFPAVETALVAAVIDPAGRYAYFASRSSDQTVRLIKVDLATFQRVGAAALDGAAEADVGSAVIDPAGRYAYIGTMPSARGARRVVKVDLDRLQRVAAISLDSPTTNINAAVMDPAGRYAYFGAGQTLTTATSKAPGPSAVLKVDLSTFGVAETAYLPPGEVGNLVAGAIDPTGDFAYFGKAGTVGSDITGTSKTYPEEIVKVALSRAPVPWLVAGNDSYSTPFATTLSVPAPGVLANDRDTADADPLTAEKVTDPAHGQVAFNPNGSFTYTPADGFSGTDAFTYKASDAMDYSAPATVSITVAPPPPGVQAVSGGAFGFYTNVGLFGGAPAVKGGPGSTCGQTGQPACAAGQSVAVALAPGGGSLSATDPVGNVAQYGPARIFENHGPLTVQTQGSTGPAGSSSSSASVKDISDNDPFHAGAPDGEASSTCTATRAGLTGSSRIVNGRLVTSTDPTTGAPKTQVTFPHTWDPAPNTQYNGTMDHVGDRWRIVFNEQVLSPDSITVNAVHLYLLGSTAVGDMIIGQSRCGVKTLDPNAAPVARDDSYTTTAAHPFVVASPGVLANDTDPDAQPLRAATLAGIAPPAGGGGTWTFPSDPAHGTLNLGADGSFTYTPNPGFVGTDTFTYLAQDTRGAASQATATITVLQRAVADFGGTGKTDFSVYRPSTGAWYVAHSGGGTTSASWGAPGDIAVPGDYNGDGKTDFAVYRPSNGAWYVAFNGGGTTSAFWGTTGDIPVPGDYNGTGKTDIAVYRPSTGAWYVLGGPSAFWGGAPGDIPVPGDYNGTGKTDMAVYRPSTGAWYVLGGPSAFWGAPGDVPVPGDYNGTGKTNIAVYRPSNGAWYVLGGSNAFWGAAGDVPVPGGYNGTGKTNIAVYRPSNGAWYVLGGPSATWGASGDQPLPLPYAIRNTFFPSPP